MSTHRIEVSEQYSPPLWICSVKVPHDLFNKKLQVSNAGSSAKRSHSDWASLIGYANTPMEKLTISTHFSASIWIHGLKREVFCARHTLWLPINSCWRWKNKLYKNSSSMLGAYTKLITSTFQQTNSDLVHWYKNPGNRKDSIRARQSSDLPSYSHNCSWVPTGLKCH